MFNPVELMENAIEFQFETQNPKERTVTVAKRWNNKWVVVVNSFCYAADLSKVWEPRTDFQTTQFFEKYHFTLEEAYNIAQKLVQTINTKEINYN